MGCDLFFIYFFFISEIIIRVVGIKGERETITQFGQSNIKGDKRTREVCESL